MPFHETRLFWTIPWILDRAKYEQQERASSLLSQKAEELSRITYLIINTFYVDLSITMRQEI